VRGTFVHVHAFAEEMNKARRMVSLAARALAAQGWAVLLLDLDGCGDSTGDFGDAIWNGWIDDVLFAHRWANEQFRSNCWLWGFRAGCLLAAEASARLGGQTPLLLWQPVLSGRLHFTQFLRVKLASEMLTQGEERTGVKTLRAQLAAGTSLEIAGYVLNPSLAASLEQSELRLDRQLACVAWLEISADAEPRLSPASETRLSALRERGIPVEATAVTGPQFWQTVEISECPAFIDATLSTIEKRDVCSV